MYINTLRGFFKKKFRPDGSINKKSVKYNRKVSEWTTSQKYEWQNVTLRSKAIHEKVKGEIGGRKKIKKKEKQREWNVNKINVRGY